MSVRRGTNELFEDGVERVTRSPARCRAQLCGTAHERRNIRGANERGIRSAISRLRRRGQGCGARARPCSVPTPLAMLYASPGTPRSASATYARATSSTCEKSRIVSVFPITSGFDVPRSATARRTSAGTTKLGDWPGPVWLNGRTAITRTPPERWASSASTSCAAFEAAYTPIGLLRRASVERHLGGGVATVLLATANDDHHRIECAGRAARAYVREQARGDDDVDLERASGIRIGGGHVRDAREMEDRVGCGGIDRLACRRR